MGITSGLPTIALATALSFTAVFNAHAQEGPAPDTPQQEQTQEQEAPSYDMAEFQTLIDQNPATITDQRTLDKNLLQIVQNMDTYYVSPQTRENVPDDFNALETPFTLSSLARIEDYIHEGADVNYIDPQTNASTFAYALWMAYEMDKPEIVEMFINNGADVHLRVPKTNMIPRAEQNAYDMLFDGRPDTGNTQMTILDHAALALLESQGLNTSPLGERSSINHVRTAANITAQILNEGAVWSDIKQLPKTISTPRGPLPTSFGDVNTIIQSYAAADVFFQEGLITTQQRHEHIYGSSELRDKAMSLTEINDTVLENIGAKIVNYPDVPPGGPEPYEVTENDTVWNIAGRFAPFMGQGITTHEDAFWAMAELNNMTVLPRNNVMRVDENGATKIGIEAGETLLVPVDPSLQIGRASSPQEVPVIAGLLTKHIVDIADIRPSRMQAIFPKIVEDLVEANGYTMDNRNEIFRVNKEIIIPKIEGVDYPSVTFTMEDIMRAYAEQYNDNFYIDNASPDQVYETIAQLNGLDNIELCQPDLLADGESCPLFWMPYKNDTYDHYDNLVPPSDIDPDRRVDLFVVETESYHQKMATRAAAGTNYALNPDVDYTQFHVLVDPVWGAHVQLGGRSASEGLKVLQHPENPLKDNIVYTSSMHSFAVGNEKPRSPIISNATGENIRNMRNVDNILVENTLSSLKRMEEANPILFQAIGNEFPYDGNFGFDVNDIHSGRVVMTGAVGSYPARGQDVHGMAPYSSVGADICFQLPQELGRQNEGTSFSTPTGSAVYRQMSEWYGHRLTFEEIMAAGMMTASQDTPEIVRGRFGVRAKDAEFRVNGAGVPFNYRCGAGEAIPEKWNEALKEMVGLKESLPNAGENQNHTMYINIGDADEIKTLENGDNIFTYRIPVTRGLTLTKQTFILPQEANAHSEVIVRMPSGFEYHLPKSLTDVVSTSAFNYEDVKEGDVIEIITGQPLGEKALMLMRGVEDGNAIQALRDALQQRGLMHEPGTVVKSNGDVTQDEGVDIDLTPDLPEQPDQKKKAEAPTPSPH